MKVGVIMGSTSDLEVMTPAIETLQQFGIEVDKRVFGAHRAPHVATRAFAPRRSADPDEVFPQILFAKILRTYRLLPHTSSVKNHRFF